MTGSRQSLGWILMMIAIAAGTLVDRPRHQRPLLIDGFRALAVDFHVHSSLWSSGALTPWGVVLQAERDGLDAFAGTGHNAIATGKVSHWFATRFGGPIVLVGEEIRTPRYHLIAAGITRQIGFRQTAAAAIAEVHRQGGIAIAAHPGLETRGYDATALRELDGTEICHPMIYQRATAQRDLEEFASFTHATPIGSSDFHAFGPMGLCRTWVFARDDSAQGIIEGVRAHRTVVYGLGGKAYGDPEWIARAERCGLRGAAPPEENPPFTWVSRIAGVIGLVLVAMGEFGRTAE